jgi:glyoxylase-like metal-dependent hydrolase (beta-lactamase superfamily II)
MADRRRAVPENVPGEVFVDDTCIDCDLCRELAPDIFADAGGHSHVRAQPLGDAAQRWAWRAALACPTGSIGAPGSAAAGDDFPLPVDDAIAFCGYASRESFGGRSWFLRHPEGNWLIDAPRWVPRLADRLAAAGGVARIFLTHQDDVADAARYGERFAAELLIHARDRHAAPSATAIASETPVPLASGVLAIPTPGHTAGSWCLLAGDTLFTGDHLWWDRDARRLDASRAYCWHDWDEQRASLARLREHDFAQVLPGHGDPIRLTPEAMRAELAALLARLAG